MLPDFLDEDISALFHTDEYNHDVNTWTLFFDGASNVMGHGIGVVLISLENQCIPMTTRLCFDCIKMLQSMKPVLWEFEQPLNLELNF